MKKIGGKAKAMLVTERRVQAVLFKQAIDDYIQHNNLKFKTLVAFSGTVTVNGKDYTENSINNPEKEKDFDIVEKFEEDDYKILIVAGRDVIRAESNSIINISNQEPRDLQIIASLLEGKEDILTQVVLLREQIESTVIAVSAQTDIPDSESRIAEARAELDPEDPTGWNQLGHLLRWSGDLDEAEIAYSKVLALGESGNENLIAAACNNLGMIYQTRGNIDRAIDMYEKSLVRYKEIGLKEGIATLYGNLGSIYMNRGDFNKALNMYEKSLTINESHGNKRGMASVYGNLGLIHKSTGEFDRAIEMHELSINIYADFGNSEGVATQTGNLGIVYKTLGDLDSAVEMFEKSLHISTDLEYKEDMSATYSNKVQYK
ncbi:MAG: tetratricopeptide repeat protein [Proteobacteria bacterium]|nr:tetratricopeptide repeat protein [Pseudomonadota bacterium]